MDNKLLTNVFHLLILAPLLIYTGYQGYQKKPIPRPIYSVLLILGIFAIVVHGGWLSLEKFDILPNAGGFSTGTIDQTPRELPVQQTHVVEIVDYEFRPKYLHVFKGDTVRWVNQDNTAHVVHSYTDLFRSEPIAKDHVFEHTFNTHGVYSYLCDNHPYTKGSISVNMIARRHSGHEVMVPPETHISYE